MDTPPASILPARLGCCLLVDCWAYGHKLRQLLHMCKMHLPSQPLSAHYSCGVEGRETCSLPPLRLAGTLSPTVLQARLKGASSCSFITSLGWCSRVSPHSPKLMRGSWLLGSCIVSMLMLLSTTSLQIHSVPPTSMEFPLQVFFLTIH